MSVPLAYFGVVIIWTTTPLAIQWSSEGPGFLFGVTARMALACVIALLVVNWIGGGFKWDRRSMLAHLAAGLGIYGAMGLVYWSSQFIPSGWISVVFGTSPLITGVLAYFFLKEDAFAANKVLGMLLGVGGLAVMFSQSLNDHASNAWYGLVGVLLSTVIHAASAVSIKRIKAPLTGLQSTSGGLLIALPLFLLTWGAADGQIPQQLPLLSIASILYLGIIGSVLGFSMYYFVLGKLDASRVALITLITPVSALMLGHWLNSEPLSTEIIIGTSLIVIGLTSYQFGGALWANRVAVAER